MLRTAAQTEELLGGADGLAAAVPASAVRDVIVMSTLEPELDGTSSRERTAARLDDRRRAGERRRPRRGGGDARDHGVAGPPRRWRGSRPLLEVLGGSIFVLGERARPRPGGEGREPGDDGAPRSPGRLEALGLVARLRPRGRGRHATPSRAGTGASWVLDALAVDAQPAGSSYEPGNALDILLKDLRARSPRRRAAGRRAARRPRTRSSACSRLEPRLTMTPTRSGSTSAARSPTSSCSTRRAAGSSSTRRRARPTTRRGGRGRARGARRARPRSRPPRSSRRSG